MNLLQFLVYISECALTYPDKYIKSGHNGPYKDPETPMRNYGHWLITFCKCFELTGKIIYLEKIEELAEYLISDYARPFGYSFHHRSKEGKDKCNGLIGQAWTFEALAYASFITKNQKYSDYAQKVFFQHTFNEDLKLWNRLNIDGEILSIDPTFNHQLWFAACASLLKSKRQKEIKERIFRFLDFVPNNLSFIDNELIYHLITNQFSSKKLDSSLKSKLKKITKSLFYVLGVKKWDTNKANIEYKKRMIYKSIGYHHFNMYAFAMLKEQFPDHPIWDSPKFIKSVDYLISDKFKNELSDNIYGFPYNPPGFEVPYALSVFTDLSGHDLVTSSFWWVNEQFKRCYNVETRMMDRNTEDPITHTARIYEVNRLPNSILERIEVDL